MSVTSFGSLEMLLLRLQTAVKKGKRISILVGSGLTAPDVSIGQTGVSSVNDIVEDIHDVFKRNSSEDLFKQNVPEFATTSEKYQRAMQTLVSCFGQDEANKIIINAVLNALSKNAVVSSEKDLDFKVLEKDVSNWHLRVGVKALGEIYVDFNEIFAGPILTSNFDPLIEVSIRNFKGNPQSIFIVNDGKFLNQNLDSGHPVVHFHGFWHGSDTLHTIDQLKRERPQLRGDLKKLLNDSILLVVGYGGWNDVFTNTLVSLIAEGNSNFDVLWTFYEKDEDQIRKFNESMLKQMANTIGQRVNLYKAIDCNELFPRLLKQLNYSSDLIQNQIQKILVNETVEEKKDDESFRCDVPPNNLFWVGREKEISMLSQANYKTSFITGFGGQGKSGLASHFVKNIIQNHEEYEMWDWRDCKEESNKFQTIIISQIERISKGALRASKLTDAKIDELIEIFFEILKDRKIVFVYDNVDKYIDLEQFNPIAGLKQLFIKANSRIHNSLFIFTCRPHISFTDNNFLEIQLRELSEGETMALFEKFNPPIANDELIKIAKQSHQLTNGHALWLNLIAAQSRRGLDVVNLFLNSYQQNKISQKDNPSYSLAQNTLDIVWKSLTYKQQMLLRGLAEMITALTKDELQDIFRSELSGNQFNKCFNVLNSLNLLVIKSHSGKADLVELHPLVKGYVQFKYIPVERSKFIMLFVNFYNNLIVLIKPKLDSSSPLSYFEKYTHRAELQINNGDFKNALLSLEEVSSVMNAAGYNEEYIRVAVILFDKIDWLKAITEEYTYFVDQFVLFTKTLTEKGKFKEVEYYLQKYVNLIPGKSVSYLAYCNVMSYYFWFKNEQNKSIEWAEKGLELTRQTGVVSGFNTEHNLALALRDTKDPENIDRSLKLFLKGEDLENVLNESVEIENFSSTYFGNIGRCLWFLGRKSEALKCYILSFNLLLKEKNSSTHINIGYASFWIFEVLLDNGENIEALYFLKNCLIKWENYAPFKAINVRQKYNFFLDSPSNIEQLSTLSPWDVETFCKKYVDGKLSLS